MSKITVICHLVDGRLGERTSKFVTEDLLWRKSDQFPCILREFIRNKQPNEIFQFSISKGNKASLKLINISNGEVLAKT